MYSMMVQYNSTSHYNFTNMSLEQYLQEMRGPKQLPLNIAIPFTIFNLVIFVTGIVGNISVCVVIVKHSSMHTATNYYLFSLAISDLTMLIFGLPNDVTVYWHQYPWTLGVGFCKFRALLSESASYVSVLTIVAFSMERYLAICHPLHLYAMSGFQRAVRIIAALWIIAFLSATPFAVFTTVDYLEFPEESGNLVDESAFCGMLTQPDNWPLSEISTIVFFIVPMLVIMVLYIRMGIKIRRRTLCSLGSVHGENRHSQNRKAIIRMLAAVVIAFFICWAPFHAQRLIYIYGKDSKYFLTINEWMFYITGLLYYVSSTVNPILYNVMSNRYRVAFRETLCCCCQPRTSNGFSREQSSVRETTRYDGTQLIRVGSVPMGGKSVRYKHHRFNINNANENYEKQVGLLNENNDNFNLGKCVKRSDVLVVLKPAINGKTKCYTTANNVSEKEEEAHVVTEENGIENNVETRI